MPRSDVGKQAENHFHTWNHILNPQAGAVWHNGTGAPDVGLGNNGDYYLDNSTGDVYAKALGAWSLVANLKGATGSPGADGSVWYNGSGDPPAGTGVSGDYYLDVLDGDVFEKNYMGWSLVGNIKGPTGSGGPPGPTGPGVPTGGTTGQVLHKKSNTDLDTEWHSLGGAAELNVGTTAGTVAAGDDGRLSDARTPTSHAASHNAGGGDALTIDAAAATGSLRTLGTSATSACAGNDSRLSDARTPVGTALTKAKTWIGDSSNVAGAMYPPISVRYYGAIGDGSTDDTTAIQAALTAAVDGQAVTLDGGNYKITAHLYMSDGTSLIDGKITSYGGKAVFPGNRSTVRNVQIWDTDQNSTAYQPQCWVNAKSDVTVDGCYFWGNNGVVMDSGIRCKVMNSRFVIGGGYGITATAYSKNCLLSGNTFTYRGLNSAGGIRITGACRDFTIIHNSIQGSNNFIQGIIAIPDLTSVKYSQKGHLIAHNSVQDIKEEGISIDNNIGVGTTNTTATSGVTRGTYDVISVAATLVTNAKAGYFIQVHTGAAAGTFAEIISNTTSTITCQKYSLEGILNGDTIKIAPYVANCIISDNTVKACAYTGIMVFGGVCGIKVRDNLAVECGTAADRIKDGHIVYRMAGMSILESSYPDGDAFALSNEIVGNTVVGCKVGYSFGTAIWEGCVGGSWPRKTKCYDNAAIGCIEQYTVDAGTDLITTLTGDVTNDYANVTTLAGSAIAARTNNATAKNPLVDADEFPLADSEATYGLKKTLWSSIKSTLKTYFDAIYGTITNMHIKHGFENRTDSVMTFTDTSPDRTFKIAKTGSGFSYWRNGTKVTKTTDQTVQITNTVGAWFIYFNSSDVLTASQTPWSIDQVNVPVAIVYWNGTTNRIQEERHGCIRNTAWHLWAHDTIGTRYESGLVGTFTNTTLSVTQGVIFDEDIEWDTGGTLTACCLWYLSAATSKMTFSSPSTTPYATTGGNLAYDNAGTLTAVDSGKHVVNDVYCSLDQLRPIYVRVGTAQYTTIANARAAPQATWANTVTAELKLLYRVIYKNNGGVINYVESIDYRTGGSLPGGGTGPLAPHASTHTAAGSDALLLTENYMYVGNASGKAAEASPATVAALISAATVSPGHPCEGRLTLTTGVPVTTADVTGATTLYYTPYIGNCIALYSGSAWLIRTFSELSLSLSGWTANKPSDIWIYDNSGTPTLDRTEWTNDTTRATALAYQDGVLVKSGDATRRYLGTIRTTGTTGQCENKALGKRFVWNYYNQVAYEVQTANSNGSWSYTTGAWREYNNGTGQTRGEFIIGVAEEPIYAGSDAYVSAVSAGIYAYIGYCFDATNTAFQSYVYSTTGMQRVAQFSPWVLSAGYHYLTQTEYSTGSSITVSGAGYGARATIRG